MALGETGREHSGKMGRARTDGQFEEGHNFRDKPFKIQRDTETIAEGYRTCNH